MLQISATSSYCHQSLMANRTTSHMGYACTYQCSTPSSAYPDACMASPKSDGGRMYQEGKENMFSGAIHRSIHAYRRQEREPRPRPCDIFIERGRARSDEYKDCLHLTCSSGLEDSLLIPISLFGSRPQSAFASLLKSPVIHSLAQLHNEVHHPRPPRHRR